jgi:hypothetical protein
MSQPTISTGFSGTAGNAQTYLVWGTDGYLQTPAPGASRYGTGYYIVESIEEDMKVEQIYGENGTGIEAWRVTLQHGMRWNITVQDDSDMTPPAIETSVGVVDMINNRAVYYSAKVLNNNYRAARKQPGHRVLLAENLTLVDDQTQHATA